MADVSLCYLSAGEALRLFRARKLSPVELLRAQIERAEQVEPRINAFALTFFDRALEAARSAEDTYMKSTGQPRPLEGLAVAIKDDVGIEGQRTALGSLIFRDEIADHTHPMVERLLDAGAIVHARTTVPEFCSAGVTYSKLYGVTGTPWNPDFTSGGSSGGSGACLAAGTSMLATGSDIAGSIRVPAACCGVVGYKPPYGRVPNLPPSNLDWYSHLGPLTRTVGDCALMLNIIAGPHPRDIVSLREPMNLPTRFAGIEGWRIAYSVDLGGLPVAPDIHTNTERSLDVFRALGAETVEVELGWGGEVTEAAIAYLDHLFGRKLARAYEEHGDQLMDYNIFYAERAQASDTERYLWSHEVAGRMYETLGPLLDAFDVFICPTLVTHEIKADAGPWDWVQVGGRDVDCDFGWVMTHPFNMLSRLPVLTVPSGLATNGLPTSIQIVARTYDDARVFQAGAALEGAQPWLDCPKRRPGL